MKKQQAYTPIEEIPTEKLTELMVIKARRGMHNAAAMILWELMNRDKNARNNKH